MIQLEIEISNILLIELHEILITSSINIIGQRTYTCEI